MPSPKNASPTFEQALARLEQVVQELESSEVPLEKALSLVEEGEKLYQLCHQQLTVAEGKIEQLMERLTSGSQAEPLVVDGAPPRDGAASDGASPKVDA